MIKSLEKRFFLFTSLVVISLLLVPCLCPFLSADEQTDIDKLYAKKCAMCHGVNGVPKKFAKGSPDFSNTEWKNSVSEEDLVIVISKGKGKMPSFQSRLTEDQIKALAAYLLAL